MAYLEVSGVSKTYAGEKTQTVALQEVSLTVERGEFVTIVGRSGSGKSTLMNLLGCLDVPTVGTYRLNGQDVAALTPVALAAVRNREIGFIFQQFHLIGSLTALENVELPLIYRGLPRSERRQRALECLDRMGLSDRLHHRPAQLSGGQQQRVAIARAVAGEPSLLLADEPTGNLDATCAAEVMETLRQLHRDGRTVLLITHDPVLAKIAPRRVCIVDGRLSEQAANGERG